MIVTKYFKYFDNVITYAYVWQSGHTGVDIHILQNQPTHCR